MGAKKGKNASRGSSQDACERRHTEISSEAASVAPLGVPRLSDPCPTSGIFVPRLRFEAVSIVGRFSVLAVVVAVGLGDSVILGVVLPWQPNSPPSKLSWDSLGGEMG